MLTSEKIAEIGGESKQFNSVSVIPVSVGHLSADERPRECLATIWDAETAKTEWRRYSRLYGKDLVGAIPPDAQLSPKSKVHPKSRGKVPGYRKADGTWFGRSKPLSGPEADTTVDELKQWAGDLAGIGIMGRGYPGLDNDASNERIRDGLREIIHKHVGVGPRRGRPNSIRDLHMLFGPGLTSWQIKYRPPGKPPGDKADLLELKATGNYYNLEGLHSPGVRYTWENGHPCDGRGESGFPKIDQIISEAIHAEALAFLNVEGCEIVEGSGPSSSGGPRGRRVGLDDDPRRHDETAGFMFMALYSNDRKTFPYYGNAPESETTKDAMCVEAALWTAFGPNREQHRDRLFEWHMGDPDNTEERFEANLAKFDKEGTSLGAEFLYTFPKMRAYADERRLERAQETWASADPVPPEYLDDAPSLVPGVTRRVKRPAILFFDQLGEQPAETQDFVENSLCDGQLGLIFGESGVGKTFAASELAMCVSLGWPWHGRDVEQGGVIYVAGEGAAGLRQRIAAFRQHHGMEKTAGAQIAIVPNAVNFRDDGEVDGLIEAIKDAAGRLGDRVRLIVVDTLSRAIAGGNENSSEDMGAVITAADKIRTETGAHVLFIHHSGKDDTKGARGHSLLRAAVDSEFKIERADGGIITMTATKQRDLECDSKPVAFKLREVNLGTNRRGKKITSCVVEPCETLPPKAKPLPPAAKEALDILREMLGEQEDDATIKITVWRDAVFAALERDGYASEGSRRKIFSRVRKTLQDAGAIEAKGDDVTIPWTAFVGGEGRGVK